MKHIFSLAVAAVMAPLAVALTFGTDLLYWLHDHLSMSLGIGGAWLGAVVQASYSERIGQAVAGMPANMRTWDGRTMLNASSKVGFGLALGQGSADNECLLGQALTSFVGISMRDVTLAPVTADSDYLDHYPQKASVAVWTQGAIWVQIKNDVAAGGAVYYDATTGKFDDASSGNVGPLPGARWETSGTAAGTGIARLSLAGVQRT